MQASFRQVRTPALQKTNNNSHEIEVIEYFVGAATAPSFFGRWAHLPYEKLFREATASSLSLQSHSIAAKSRFIESQSDPIN